MNQNIFLLVLLFSGMFITGCTTIEPGGTSSNDRLTLMTNEIARLDAALKQTQTAFEQEQQNNADCEARLEEASKPTYMSMTQDGPVPALSTLSSNMYVTPSGFKIPAKDLQLALKNAGFYGDDIDGEIGENTRTAVEKYQRANGLSADGVVGPKTWEKLKQYL